MEIKSGMWIIKSSKDQISHHVASCEHVCKREFSRSYHPITVLYDFSAFYFRSIQALFSSEIFFYFLFPHAAERTVLLVLIE